MINPESSRAIQPDRLVFCTISVVHQAHLDPFRFVASIAEGQYRSRP